MDPGFPPDSKALLHPVHYPDTTELMICASVLVGGAVAEGGSEEGV